MKWELLIHFRVYGLPRPGGSKTAFYNKKLGRAMIVDACKTVKTWRQDVKTAALSVKPDALFDGCLRFDCTFLMPRPKGHFRTGKNAHLLRDTAPPCPNTKPDLLKLGRSTEDALTGIMWVDDARIVHEILSKSFAVGGETIGADILIWKLVPEADQ